MMTHTYNISGMTCNSCIAKVKSQLLKLGDIIEADVQIAAPQGTIKMQKHIPLPVLQQALTRGGNYTITEAETMQHQATSPIVPGSEQGWLAVYTPILLIGAYITGITLLPEMQNGFQWERWMQHFMAGFFLVFSFFKLLNIKGFAESYAMYDIIAKRWAGWGYVYAFIELGLGIAYLLNGDPVITNAITFTVMSISIVGVLQSVLKKQKIRCACLGAVFNLPMSTITIIEDALMIGMSFAMLLTHFRGF